MSRSYRFGFVVEDYIGHANFARLLQEAVDADPSIAGEFCLIGPGADGLFDRLPVVGANLTVRVSRRAHAAVSEMSARADAVLVHTQTAALFLSGLGRRVPIVVSTDGTPANIDEIGAFGQGADGSRSQRVKTWMTRQSLRNTTAFIAWTDWVAESLVDDYSVARDRIHVLSPGVDVERWASPARDRTTEPFRVLFVGGDFERKGGPLLIEAMNSLDGLDWRLDLVTNSRAATDERTTVHSGVKPGDGRLKALYDRADLFVLPTAADTYGFAVLEAMASGLPVVTTQSGGLAPALGGAKAGLILNTATPTTIRQAVGHLADHPGLRAEMGARARALVEERFDAKVNVQGMLDVLRGVAR